MKIEISTFGFYSPDDSMHEEMTEDGALSRLRTLALSLEAESNAHNFGPGGLGPDELRAARKGLTDYILQCAVLAPVTATRPVVARLAYDVEEDGRLRVRIQYVGQAS